MRTLLATLCVFLLPMTFASAEMLTLSQDDKTDYTIVLPETPTPVEQTAAKELKEHLDAVTGAGFPIKSETENISGPKIFVGETKTAKNLVDVSKISYDGTVIKTAGKDLVLVGHPRRGTLYAVYSLLQDTVGVRWWTSTESYIPKKPTLEIPEQNVEYAPKLTFRETSYRDIYDPVFSARMRRNGGRMAIPEEYGGCRKFFHYVHSFYPLLPPKKYFDEHPEWYSEINGKRVWERGQLCLSNAEMRAELIRNVLDGLRNRPDCDFVSVSQNDWHGYCTCKNCAKIAEEEGGQSGLLIRFVNAVAEEVEKEFPDVWVETLAYQYTRKPPRHVKPRKNVMVRLCSIECSFLQPLGRGEQNKEFRDDIEGWSRIADQLFIWDYTVNFSAYMLPHPNHRVLAPNIRFFLDHKVVGLYEQGDSFCLAGDFVRMKTWVLTRLMWDPSLDENKLFDEFITGYYGPEAAPLVKEYRNLLLDAAERSDIYLRCYQHTTSGWLDTPTFLKARNLMKKAAASTGDETFRNRLLREKMAIDLVFLKEYHSRRRLARMLGEDFPVSEDPAALVDDFFERCKRFGVTAYREGDTKAKFQTFEQGLRRSFGPPAAPPKFCKELPETDWFEISNYELFANHLGELTFYVDDAAASTGQAVKMPGTHRRWSTTYTFDESLRHFKSSDVEEPGYRVYAAVRCEATAKDGLAMTLGVYDYNTKKNLASRRLSVADIAGKEYKWIDLGVVPLVPRCQVWFAPPERPGEVEAVYVDRVVVVRER